MEWWLFWGDSTRSECATSSEGSVLFWISVTQSLTLLQTEKGKMFYNFIAGAVAGTFGTILNTPSDVVKSRIQNQGPVADGGRPKYYWALPSAQTIMKEEGFAALYKGFVPKVVRLGPGGGILLVVFEFVSKKLKEWSTSP